MHSYSIILIISPSLLQCSSSNYTSANQTSLIRSGADLQIAMNLTLEPPSIDTRDNTNSTDDDGLDDWDDVGSSVRALLGPLGLSSSDDQADMNLLHAFGKNLKAKREAELLRSGIKYDPSKRGVQLI